MTANTLTLDVRDLASRYDEVLDHLQAGREVVVERADHTGQVRLLAAASQTVAPPAAPLKPRTPGLSKGIVLYMSPDFDDEMELVTVRRDVSVASETASK